ncbi:MAG: hypothetical protein NTZ32_01095 [Planctomycetales bacterium]|nr:hypothetical protein [Planctomycetales bacterium]
MVLDDFNSLPIEPAMHCPFPDCRDRQAQCDELSDGVYLCGQCGRLASLCIASNCKTLNRPFARFCRHCRAAQSTDSQQSPGHQRWSAFAEFDRPWHFQSAQVSDSEVCSVIDFHHQIPGYRRPQRLLSHTWFDGLLAIHQAGAYAAIVHPFADRAQQEGHSALCWSTSDHVGGSPGQVTSDLRAFPPVVTPDRRFLLFSSPRAVFGVEVASLPGWGVMGNTHEFTVLTEDDLAGFELAAAPVALSPVQTAKDQTGPCLVGLLLRSVCEATYRWRVVDLQKTDTVVRPLHECSLPLLNSQAQILSAAPQAIVFATKAGHWWWTWQDAQNGSAENLRRSWQPRLPDDELALDKHIVELNLFTWQRQHLVAAFGQHSLSHGAGVMELCYARSGRSGTAPAEFYKVNIADSHADHPTELSTTGRLIPIGTDGADLLFLGNTAADRTAELWRRDLGVNRASSLPGVIAQQITDVIGVQIRAPLMLLVCNDDQSTPVQRRYRVRVLRLDSSPNYETVEIPGLCLMADPIVCAEYLFTIEQHDEGMRLVRRRLPTGQPMM